MTNYSANQETLIQVEKGIKNPANQTLCYQLGYRDWDLFGHWRLDIQIQCSVIYPTG
jgi:hypothetical protein